MSSLQRLVEQSAKRIHDSLGNNFTESIYHQALLVELRTQNVPYETEKIIPVFYSDQCVGSVRADVVVDKQIVVEIKAISKLREADKQQLQKYAKLTQISTGLLINFGSLEMEIWGCNSEIEIAPQHTTVSRQNSQKYA